jgi:phosphoglycerol transferase
VSAVAARARSAWRRSDAGTHLTVVLVTSLLAVLALELWRADLTVPFTYWGDALAVGAHFKTTLETGWYESQPLLGAPWGQAYHDFPTSDNGNFLAATILTHLTGSWALAMNLYYLIGFPLAALTMAWFLRVAGASKAMTIAIAPLFALLSYHFMRGESHLWLASYFAVPLSLVLVLRAARGEPLWGWGTRWPTGWRRVFGRGLQTLAIVALTGTMQSYYALFFLILIAAAGIVAVIRDRSWRRFWGAAVAGVLTLVVMVLNMLPDTVYSLVEGPNPTGFERGHAEAELWSLKLSQLLLPWPGHRIGPLAELRQLYDTSYPIPSEQPALGIVGAVGLLCLLGILLYAAIAGRALPAPQKRIYEHASFDFDRVSRIPTLLILAGLALLALLFAMVGGFSTPISFLTTSIRGWNRMVVFIAVFALAAVALLVDALLARMARRAIRRTARPPRGYPWWAGAFAVVLLIVGYVDQTPGDLGEGYAATAQQYRSDQAFFDEVQAQLEPGDWVLQLPYQSFPEDQSATGVYGSDVVIPYLHTEGIGWSGGGIKGRPQADWPEYLQQQPAETIPGLARGVGAAGILVDTTVLTPSLDDLVPGITGFVGDPIVSEGGRYEFWSLKGLELGDAPPEVRNAVLEPVIANLRETFDLGWNPDGSPRATAKRDDPAIELINPLDTPQAVYLELRFSLGASLTGTDVSLELPDDVTINVPDTWRGPSPSLTARREGSTAEWAWWITVPPGTSTIGITTAAPAGVVPELSMESWRVVPGILMPQPV